MHQHQSYCFASVERALDYACQRHVLTRAVLLCRGCCFAGWIHAPVWHVLARELHSLQCCRLLLST
jgi:hypothetical protein